MTTQFPVFTSRIRTGDFLIWEVDPGQRYCRVSAPIRNAGSNAIAFTDNTVGIPLNLNGSTWETVAAGGESGVDGILISEDPISLAASATTERSHIILVRGPALINADLLAATDMSGDDLNQTNLVIALKALGIQPMYEPPEIEEGV